MLIGCKGDKNKFIELFELAVFTSYHDKFDKFCEVMIDTFEICFNK